jgi:hypothetical protein
MARIYINAVSTQIKRNHIFRDSNLRACLLEKQRIFRMEKTYHFDFFTCIGTKI